MELFHVDSHVFELLNGIHDEDLPTFATLQEEPTNDKQTEAYIYARFLLFSRTRFSEYLSQATRRAEMWVAATPVEDPDRTRRSSILDMLSAGMHRQSTSGGDIMFSRHATSQEVAFDQTGYSKAPKIISAWDHQKPGNLVDQDEAHQAVAHPTGTDIREEYIGSVNLNDLSTMLRQMFERNGSFDDLNRAIDTVRQALNARVMNNIDGAVPLTHSENWHSVDNAVQKAVQIYSSIPPLLGGPDGEIIYANTPQHHSKALPKTDMTQGSDNGL